MVLAVRECDPNLYQMTCDAGELGVGGGCGSGC